MYIVTHKIVQHCQFTLRHPSPLAHHPPPQTEFENQKIPTTTSNKRFSTMRALSALSPTPGVCAHTTREDAYIYALAHAPKNHRNKRLPRGDWEGEGGRVDPPSSSLYLQTCARIPTHACALSIEERERERRERNPEKGRKHRKRARSQEAAQRVASAAALIQTRTTARGGIYPAERVVSYTYALTRACETVPIYSIQEEAGPPPPHPVLYSG